MNFVSYLTLLQSCGPYNPLNLEIIPELSENHSWDGSYYQGNYMDFVPLQVKPATKIKSGRKSY